MAHGEFFLLLVTIQLLLASICHTSELYDDNQPSSDDVLSKYWGIRDTDTVVGRLFQCKIPPEKDAFKGTIVKYDVEGEVPSKLPNWLIFDQKRSVLEGVPTIEDIGDTPINVKAYDTKGKFASDMFVIEVYPLEDKNTNNKRKCKSGEEVMMFAIVIDKNLNAIPLVQRISAIRTLSHHLNIPQDTILLLPQLLAVDNPLIYLQSDGKFSDTNTNSSILTWQIGCNEQIWAEQLDVVSKVKKYAKSNALVDMLHLPVVKCHLIVNFNPFRIRRQITNGSSNETMALDEQSDDNEDEDEENEEDEDENIKSSVSPTLQNPLSSVSINGTSAFQQNLSVDNSGWILPSPSLNTTILNSSYNVSPNESEEAEGATERDDFDGHDMDKHNETFSWSPTPDLDLFSSSSSEFNSSTEKVPLVTYKNARVPPRVMKQFGPLTIEAGKAYRTPIPADIFEDEGEDGNAHNLTLKLLQNSDECKPETIWLELDSEKNILLILASIDAVSKYEIQIEATNSANMSCNTSVIINIQNPQQERKINFEVSLHFFPRYPPISPITTNLQLQLLDAIARLYGDENADKIMLRHVACEPFVFTWTNNTLDLDNCDNSTIFDLLKVLTDTEGSVNLNKRVLHAMEPLMPVEKISWKGIGLCEGVVPPARIPLPPRQNFVPIARNRIDNITIRVGELLVFQVPEDSFYDPDVSSTRELRMTLTLLDQPTLPSNNWLQFDEKNFEIYGLPMNGDVGSVAYNLVCYDNLERNNDEKAARQTIEIKVEPAMRNLYNVKFSITLNSSYTSFEEFSRVALLRRMLIQKLADLFGDKDTKSIVVSDFTRGSIILNWHNKTLPIDSCPEDRIELLRKVLLTDGKELNERVNKVLGPEFQAISAMVTPIGICEGGLTEVHAVEEMPRNVPSQEIHSFLSKAHFQHYIKEYFIEVILPVVIIVLMMMFAGIVACILYRRQRRAKWNLTDETERRTYRNKGIPVIFQDELEERLETSNKSPIIMKEEKPPLPPPEYQKTLPMATTALLSDFDDPCYQEGSSFSSRSAERNGRDKNTPTYRKPPPYVPP